MTIKYDWSLYEGDIALITIGTTGELVVGPAKIAQEFTSAFLTELGSNVYYPDYGTEFMTYLRNGLIRTDQEVLTYFNAASAAAVYTLASKVTDATPDDEILESARLDHFELEPPYLFLYVTLLTRAGLSRSIVLPVSDTEVN